MAFTCSDIIKIIIAIILPPLGVFLERGCASSFWINIILTILGYIPGIIHALYVILKYWGQERDDLRVNAWLVVFFFGGWCMRRLRCHDCDALLCVDSMLEARTVTTGIFMSVYICIDSTELMDCFIDLHWLPNIVYCRP